MRPKKPPELRARLREDDRDDLERLERSRGSARSSVSRPRFDPSKEGSILVFDRDLPAIPSLVHDIGAQLRFGWTLNVAI
jgi:hypothetical protein